MPLQIINQDITKIKCDAIVNPSDMYYSGGGGADRDIHEAAGRKLMDAACEKLPPLRTGCVEVTEGFNLPSRYVIHTTGPVWRGGHFNEQALLRSCYLNALIRANLMGLSSIAFPLISSGTFGFPRNRVLKVATEAVSDFLFATDSDMEVFICIVDKNSYELSHGNELSRFITMAAADGKQAGAGPGIHISAAKKSESRDDMPLPMPQASYRPSRRDRIEEERHYECAKAAHYDYDEEEVVASICSSAFESEWESESKPMPAMSLEEFIKQTDSGFAEMLLGLVNKKGMKFVDCYKKANISRDIAYKIRNNENYRPSKNTILAFAVALRLTLNETEQLLKTMGMSMSTSFLFDRIIEYYIRNGIYDVFEINEALFQYDQTPLGCQ